MLLKTFINKTERGLLYERGDFVKILAPGEYPIVNLFGRKRVAKVNIDTECNDETLLNYLQKHEPEMAARYLTIFELTDQEAGLLFKDGRLLEILVPGARRAYWKGNVDYTLEKVDLSADNQVNEAISQRLKQSTVKSLEVKGAENVLFARIPAYFVGVLKVDGKSCA